MKKTLLIFLFYYSICPIFGQSFIKTSINKSFFNDDYSEQSKIGFGFGFQSHLFKYKWVKLILEEDIDFRRINFSYYKGGLGGGTWTSGNINFTNLKINARTRFGKRFFGDLGVFSAYALSKKITSGESYSRGQCTVTGPTTSICTPSVTNPITNEINQFSKFDWGFLIGTGFTWNRITIELDFQGGKNTMVNARYYDFHTRQFNFSVILPLTKAL